MRVNFCKGAELSGMLKFFLRKICFRNSQRDYNASITSQNISCWGLLSKFKCNVSTQLRIAIKITYNQIESQQL